MNIETPEYPSPRILIVAAVVCLLLFFMLTPANLIAMGPMSSSLTSDIDSVRNLALLEIKLAKSFLIVTGVFLFGLYLFWNRFLDSTLYKLISSHNCQRTRLHLNYLSKLNNNSFLVVLGSILAGLLYICFGDICFTTAQLDYINREDGILENISAIIFLVTCLCTAYLGYRFFCDGVKARFFMHALLAIIFFAMFGEEISWGQRLFEIETPVYFVENNVQQEMNLHNLYGYIFDHLFIATLFSWGVVCTFLSLYSPFCRNFFDIVGLPIASTGLAFGILCITLFQSGIVYRFISPMPELRIEELRELISAVSLFVFMCESFLFFKLDK